SSCADLRESYDQLQLTVNRNVDILFVIDNSAGMAAAQAKLATAVEALIEVLERPDVDANYRIAVTTTDSGNPLCSAIETTPANGPLWPSSCRSRLDQLVSADGVDAQDLACNDLCALEPSQQAITPTPTAVDPGPRPRPWIERAEGLTNLPSGTDPAQALACLLPQGIDGCGFEAPLQSMDLALARATTPGEDSYGFMRADAVQVVVFLNDEVDCSHNPEWSTIFAVDGDKTFWSDPDAPEPSSAVCWNAGVTCSGDPSGYD